LTPRIPTIDDIREAASRLAGVALRTPLIDAESAIGGDGGRARGPASTGSPLRGVWLKPEHLQPIGAFKVRGAYNAIARLSDAERARGVVTSSSGNHGQAVAFAARRFGARAVIVMPESAPKVKVAGVRSHGGEVVFAGATRSPQQTAEMDRLAREEGLVPIPPFDHPDVIAGQGTVGLEIVEQLPDVATILVPVGGGGLIGGIAAAVAALKPSVRVIGVEPAGAPKLSAALAAGGPTELPDTASIADGLLTRSVGRLTWATFSGVVREAVQVSEVEIARATALLFRELRLTVEPSGAVTTAALLAGRVASAAADGPIVAVVSGGNADPEVLQRLLETDSTGTNP
jgi:threonine dehydratase